MLTLVYLLNFLDRTLICILFTPIQREMSYALLICPLACALAALCLWRGSRKARMRAEG